MILSAHQPAYLPWLGYFDKIIRSDIFVFLDNVQFEKNSFINRNLIKTNQGPLWLTIPVLSKGHLETTLLDLKINYQEKWIDKHLKTIYQNYKKSIRFEDCYPKLELLYATKYDGLADLCFEHLKFWLDEFDIKRKIVRAGALGINSKKSDLVLDLCRHFKATHYISGILGKNYLDLERFNKEGVEVEFQSYNHPQYEQLHGEFIPNMGIIDFWMNGGSAELISERNP